MTTYIYTVRRNLSIIGYAQAVGSSETSVIIHHIHNITSSKNTILQHMRVAKKLPGNLQ